MVALRAACDDEKAGFKNLKNDYTTTVHEELEKMRRLVEHKRGRE